MSVTPGSEVRRPDEDEPDVIPLQPVEPAQVGPARPRTAATAGPDAAGSASGPGAGDGGGTARRGDAVLLSPGVGWGGVGLGNPEMGPLPSPLAGWLLALLVCTGVMAFYHLEGGADFEPIDCWVAQTAREMAENGDYLVPRFAGEMRMQKSPGPYWAVIGVSRLRQSAVDEVAARIPNAVAAIVLVATIFWMGLRMVGPRVAVFAGFAAAGSALILHWSHRSASDLGLTALMTLSLAAFWLAMNSADRRQRGALTLLAWFAAGLGMIYKMPMPVVCVGLPMFLYVLLRGRWGYLANGWHLPGLLLFLAPWLPWAAAVALTEPVALDKWRVEYLDRFTGDLPNVEEQRTDWRLYLLYLAPPLLYCLPFSLSLPGALGRAVREVFSRPVSVSASRPAPAAAALETARRRDGLAFLLIWFFSHFLFFTVAAGKELRYLLPALPPLFVLLGVELAAFFSPARRVIPWRDRLGLWGVWLLLPVVLAGGAFVLRRWHRAYQLFEWDQVLKPYLVAAAILWLGFGLAAWLYVRRREHASFAAIVATMWAMWLWAWPNLMPIVQSQRPLIDLAQQVRDFRDSGLAEAATPLVHIGSQDPRIIWYGDLRPLPRVVDPLELLRLQGGKRSLASEIELVAGEMIRRLRAPEPVLMMAARYDYIRFRAEAPAALAARGETMPPVHLWMQARVGPKSRQYLVFGNRPPPWPEPELHPPSERLPPAAPLPAEPPAAVPPDSAPPPDAPASAAPSAVAPSAVATTTGAAAAGPQGVPRTAPAATPLDHPKRHGSEGEP